MARGVPARKRRGARRARAAQKGVQNAPLTASLEARREARAAKAAPTLELVTSPSEATPVLAALDARRELRELAVSGAAGLPLGPRNASWDAAAADKAVRAWAGADDAPNAKYAQAFLYKDTSDGGADAFGDYKLGFAEPLDGKLTANWGGVTAVAGALQGARGGVDIPDADKAAIRTKVEALYKKAATQYKDAGIKVPWADDKADGESEAFLLAYAEHGSDPAVLAVATLAWEDAFAAPALCADCGHPASMHGDTQDGDDTGACAASGCDCDGYEMDDDNSNLIDSSYVRIRPLTDGFKPTAELQLALTVVQSAGTEAAEYVRLRLTDFAVAPADGDITAMLPDAHKPGSRMPRRNVSPKVPAVPAAQVAGPLVWSAVLAPEGKLTSDGRAFAPDSITWRDLPLTLMAMIETSEGGHVGAEVAGRIDKIWRDETAGLIRGSGVFAETDYGSLVACAALGATPAELGLPESELTASLVADQTLRGVSVDLAIQEYETGPKSDWFDADGNWDPQPQAEDDTPDLLKLYSEDTIAVVLAAQIGMTTVCPFPAFAEAQIAMGDSLVAAGNPAFWTVTSGHAMTVTHNAAGAALGASEGLSDTEPCTDCPDGLTASAAGMVPVEPSAAWFDVPEPDELTPLTITADGQVTGHAFDYETCHIGLPGQCRTAPRSRSGYSLFHLGEVVCDDGSRVACGQITLDTGHADRGLDAASTTRHYDHTGTVVAHVRITDGKHGGWVCGALMPDSPAEKVRLLRGSKLSGDWRSKDGSLELCALLCVNVPGFPVPRAQARLVASADGGAQVPYSLVAAGIPVFEADLSPDEWEQFRALQEHLRFAQLAQAV